MTERCQGPRLLVDRLRRAIEQRDPAAQVALYRADATIVVVDPDHPPRSPKVLTGRDAVAGWIEGLCRLEMTHQVVDVVVDGDLVAFTENGRERDGTLVLSMSTLQVVDDRIARQHVVVVWDGWD